MRKNNGVGVFKGEVVREGTKNIHLAYGIISSEDAVEASGFNTIFKVKKTG